MQIDNGNPSVGRAAITVAARAFMTAFPDIVVTIENVGIEWSRAEYRLPPARRLST